MHTYYFAPGPVPGSTRIDIGLSHRSEIFKLLFQKLTSQLSLVLGREVVFIQGSASAAIESALVAVRAHVEPTLILANGTFSNRVFQYLYGDFKRPGNVAATVEQACEAVRVGHFRNVYAVQYETAASNYTNLNELGKLCQEYGSTFIVDCVSGFPYFSPPADADIVILSSSKQLRGLPAMGIVAYRKSLEKTFFKDNGYLSLVKAIEYGAMGQTPHTSLMPQIASLFESLADQLWKPGVDAIDANMTALTEGLENTVIGRKHSPVATIMTRDPKWVVGSLAEAGFHVYWNPSYMQDRVQVSLYNYPDVSVYQHLNDALHARKIK